VTRQQFYGMLTGSVIFDSVETDSRLILLCKGTIVFLYEQIKGEENKDNAQILTFIRMFGHNTPDIVSEKASL